MRKTFLASIAAAFLCAAMSASAALTETVLYSLTNNPDGAVPSSSLVISGTNLFGLSSYGGSQGSGTIFNVSTDGVAHAVIDSVTTYPNTIAVIQLGWTNATTGTNATVTNNVSNGQPGWGPFNPSGDIVVSGGNVYFTTLNGGTYDSAYGRYPNKGTLLKASTTAGAGYVDLGVIDSGNWGGSRPNGVILSADGVLFGTTQKGGSPLDAGTLYSSTLAGSSSILHVFGMQSGDGIWPIGGLVESTNQVILGTTTFGGKYNKGTIYSINTNGTGYLTVYSFGANTNDGIYPNAPMCIDSASALWGVTPSGGTNGLGTIFEIPIVAGVYNATNYSEVYSFAGGTNDLALPVGRIVSSLIYTNSVSTGTNAIFGVAQSGGIYNGVGTKNYGGVWKIIKGNYYVDYSFTNVPDGAFPSAGLTVDVGGSLYGVTAAGGTANKGAVFKITSP